VVFFNFRESESFLELRYEQMKQTKIEQLNKAVLQTRVAVVSTGAAAVGAGLLSGGFGAAPLLAATFLEAGSTAVTVGSAVATGYGALAASFAANEISENLFYEDTEDK